MQIQFTIDDIKRFWSRVEQQGECWIWQRGCNDDGYGVFQAQGKALKAHRVAWMLMRGDIPDGLLVCHDCPGGDNPACVNPAHLWLGTILDNNRDKERKGRPNHAGPGEHAMKGQDHHKAKITEDDVYTIRGRFANGEHNISKIARDYPITARAARQIIARETWKHLE